MKFVRSLIIILGASVFASLPAMAEPALVRVTDEDTTIHILGTIHALRPGIDWRFDELNAALEQSSAIYFETDIWNRSAEGMSAQIMTRGLNPQGVTLSATMSKGAWQAVSDYATHAGLSEQALEHMQPWLATLVLGAVSQRGSGVQISEGVDQQLLGQSIKQSRELRYFNSAEEHIRFLADLPLEIQSAMLLDTVRESDLNFGASEDLLNAWLGGDLNFLDEHVNQTMQEFSPGLFEVLIVGRNENWVEELSSLMETPGVYFVAVGAAHLPGEYGLIELMRARGFDVSIN